jgi:hypothetical protein
LSGEHQFLESSGQNMHEKHVFSVMPAVVNDQIDKLNFGGMLHEEHF